ncbi:hypothetical protein ANN_08714 [Periplaneta americana]|uniref:Uncharacterized protein n=1 Tax=Periplaneta americana TaxID=6978 RepID=A0ABQ8T3D4_PERAM|nr:hypothetical protein ANN_08714 [Periplaneta americana]
MPSTWPGIEPATLGIEGQRYTNLPTRRFIFCLLFNITLEKVIRDAGINTWGTILYREIQKVRSTGKLTAFSKKQIWIACTPVDTVMLVNSSVQLKLCLIGPNNFPYEGLILLHHVPKPRPVLHSPGSYSFNARKCLGMKTFNFSALKIRRTLVLLIPVSRAHCFVDFCGEYSKRSKTKAEDSRSPRSALVNIAYDTMSLKFVTNTCNC